MSYQFDGEFIEKFYLTFTMLAYESNRRFYPVGEVVGPMDKYKFTRNEVDMLFFLNSCVDKKVKPQHDFKDIDMNILNQYIPPRVSMATTCRSVEKLVQNGLAERYYLNNNRKTVYVRATEKGIRLKEEHWEFSVQNIKKLFDAAFSLEEGEEMLDTISRLLEMTIKTSGRQNRLINREPKSSLFFYLPNGDLTIFLTSPDFLRRNIWLILTFIKKIYRKCEFTIELRQNISQFNNRLLLTNIFSVKYNFFIGNPMKFFLQTLFHI